MPFHFCFRNMVGLSAFAKVLSGKVPLTEQPLQWSYPDPRFLSRGLIVAIDSVKCKVGAEGIAAFKYTATRKYSSSRL